MHTYNNLFRSVTGNEEGTLYTHTCAHTYIYIHTYTHIPQVGYCVTGNEKGNTYIYTHTHVHIHTLSHIFRRWATA